MLKRSSPVGIIILPSAKRQVIQSIPVQSSTNLATSHSNPFSRYLTNPDLISTPNSTINSLQKAITSPLPSSTATTTTTTNTNAIASTTTNLQAPKIESTPQTQNQAAKPKKGVREWIKEWGLPAIVGEVYWKRGIREFYEWQLECLQNPKLRGGANLVYTLPTSSGKTLVAEIALLRCLTLQRRSAMLVLPFVSIVSEKARSFESFANKLDFVVEAYHGSRGTIPIPPGARLIVATIEKANGVINSLLEEHRLSEIGCVVIDEVHMVGDKERGASLELLISKILHVSGSGTAECAQSNHPLQIMAMSATVPNVTLLGKWMKADTFEHAFRPVPLKEFVKIKGTRGAPDRILDGSGNEIRRVTYNKKDYDGVATLCAEVLPEHSVLVFCATKKSTESGALHITENLLSMVKEKDPRAQAFSVVSQEVKFARDLLIQKISACSHGGIVDSSLTSTIPWGVAFHNAGLTTEERELLEEAFRQKVINVLCSTSTLAAGVNLPARRVILRSPYIGSSPMSPKYYKQMVGRAGRAGLDDFGESFLFLEEKDKAMGMKLVNASSERVFSNMIDSDDKKGFERLILDGTCGGYAPTRKDVTNLISCTLYAADNGIEKLELLTDEVLSRLTRNGFLQKKAEKKETEEKESQKPTAIVVPTFGATSLGEATFHSCFSPDEAKIIYSELERARNGLVLKDELHICYLLTPISNGIIPDWPTFRACISLVSEEENHLSVFNAIGGKRNVVETRANGGACTSSDIDLDRSLTRFFGALVLLDLIKEHSLNQVADKFKQNRGGLQTFMQAASAFAGMTVSFCKRIGWWDLEVILSCYVKRLNWGVLPEILPLTEIKGVGRMRARALWNAGFKSVRAIASAKPDDLINHVQLGPFKSRVAQLVIRGAKDLLEKQAKDLQKQLEEDLSVVGNPPLKRRYSNTSSTTSSNSNSPLILPQSVVSSTSASPPLLQSLQQDSILIGLDESLSDDVIAIEDGESFPSI